MTDFVLTHVLTAAGVGALVLIVHFVAFLQQILG